MKNPAKDLHVLMMHQVKVVGSQAGDFGLELIVGNRCHCPSLELAPLLDPVRASENGVSALLGKTLDGQDIEIPVD